MLFMPPKKHSIAIIMNIFIWDLIRDNKTVIWFITCHFLKMHTVLTFIRGIIVYSILPYLFFFHLWYPCHLHFGNSGTYSKKISSTVGRWTCTRLFAWLSCRGSGQSRCFPFGFFTIASPLTQSVFYQQFLLYRSLPYAYILFLFLGLGHEEFCGRESKLG